MIFSSPIVGRGFRAVAFLACFSCAAALVSAEEKERPYLSDEVGEQLGKVRPLFDEKKWDEALVIIDKVYAKAKPGSYDCGRLIRHRDVSGAKGPCCQRWLVGASLQKSPENGVFQFWSGTYLIGHSI